MTTFALVFILLYTHPTKQIVISALTFAHNLILTMLVAYPEESSFMFSTFCIYMLLVILYFAFCCALSMLQNLVVDINQRLEAAND